MAVKQQACGCQSLSDAEEIEQVAQIQINSHWVKSNGEVVNKATDFVYLTIVSKLICSD
jgi:hypothetical protein